MNGSKMKHGISWGRGGLATALFASLAALVAACGSSSTAQCTTSKDCSHGFACAEGSCISLGDNTSGTTTSGSGSSTSTSSSTGSSSGGGPGIPPSGCLTGSNCVGDQDCAMGAHCNTALAPPQCETLYCGAEGTLCSENADCTVGLKCLGQTCVPAATCLNSGQACGQDTDCCGKSCLSNACCVTCKDLLGGTVTIMAGMKPSSCTGSIATFEQVYGCGCQAGPCQPQCATSLCPQPGGTNAAASPACLTCLQQACPTELTACMAN